MFRNAIHLSIIALVLTTVLAAGLGLVTSALSARDAFASATDVGAIAMAVAVVAACWVAIRAISWTKSRIAKASRIAAANANTAPAAATPAREAARPVHTGRKLAA